MKRFDSLNKLAGFPVMSDYSNKIHISINETEYLSIKEDIEKATLYILDTIEKREYNTEPNKEHR